MKNVKESQLRKAIVLSVYELDDVLSDIGMDISYLIEDGAIEFTSRDARVWEKKGGIEQVFAEYFGVSEIIDYVVDVAYGESNFIWFVYKD